MTPTDVDADQVDRLYELLDHNDRLFADSIWHRVTAWHRLPTAGVKHRQERKASAEKLVRDLRCALAAAGVDERTVAAT